jgi:hypothetical protein
MNDDLETRVDSVNSGTLMPLVRQALDGEDTAVVDWQVQRVHGGTFGTIFRFAGTARGSDQKAWSLILKVVRIRKDDPIDRSDPSKMRYWKREPRVYQSGFLADLPGGLVAPHCYDVDAQSADEVWLWLEDVADDGGKWPIERYGLAARHFGQFNGAYLLHRTLPSDPWLGRGLLRAQAEQASPFIDRLRASLKHPLMNRFFPPHVVEGIFRLWDERKMFLDTVDRLPQTVNHRDAFRRNLFGRRGPDGNEQTVVIDWEDVAAGPIGEELVSLVVLGPVTREVALDAVQEFEAHVFRHFLDGLRDSGWDGDPRVVRLGYTAACLRYALGLTTILQGMALDESRHAEQEKRTGQSIGEIADHWAEILRFILDRIAEARGLMSVVF